MDFQYNDVDPDKKMLDSDTTILLEEKNIV